MFHLRAKKVKFLSLMKVLMFVKVQCIAKKMREDGFDTDFLGTANDGISCACTKLCGKNTVFIFALRQKLCWYN